MDQIHLVALDNDVTSDRPENKERDHDELVYFEVDVCLFHLVISILIWLLSWLVKYYCLNN